MSTTLSNLTSLAAIPMQNPKEVLDDNLQDLRIGTEGIVSTRNDAHGHTFKGNASKWTSFNSDVIRFYSSSALQHTFHRCASVPTLVDLREVAKLNSFFVGLEIMQIASDRTMGWRFEKNVLDPVSRVVQSFAIPEGGIEGKFTPIPNLPDRFVYSNYRPLRKSDFGQHVALWIPTGTEFDRVCMIGLKMGANEYEMSEKDGELVFKNEQSMQEVFGLLFEAMKVANVKHAFLTTYMQTVFVEVDMRGKDEECSMRYSGIVKHADIIKGAEDTEDLKTVSVRLGLL